MITTDKVHIFCEACGDCVTCYGEDWCYESSDGKHAEPRKDNEEDDDVSKYMKTFEVDPSEDREDLARRLYYTQMEIYSAHAGHDLYKHGDFEELSDSIKKGWLEAADKLKETTT